MNADQYPTLDAAAIAFDLMTHRIQVRRLTSLQHAADYQKQIADLQDKIAATDNPVHASSWQCDISIRQRSLDAYMADVADADLCLSRHLAGR